MKLKVNAPEDIYEQEADRVADEVMRMSGPAKQNDAGLMNSDSAPRVQRLCSACEKREEELQLRPLDSPEFSSQQSSHEEQEKPPAQDTPVRAPFVAPQIQSGIDSLRGGGQPLSKLRITKRPVAKRRANPQSAFLQVALIRR
jgi:hypothetical protein